MLVVESGRSNNPRGAISLSGAIPLNNLPSQAADLTSLDLDLRLLLVH